MIGNIVAWVKDITNPLMGDSVRAFFRSLVTPVFTLDADNDAFATSSKEQFRYTSQTMSLEGLLNDKFDNVSRRIYIDTVEDLADRDYDYFNSEGAIPTYEYFDSEGKPAEYDYFEAEWIAQVDFIVYVPVGLIYDSGYMNFLLKKYKLVSKRYKIIEI